MHHFQPYLKALALGVHRISGYPVGIRFFGLSGDRISGGRIMDYPKTGYRISGQECLGLHNSSHVECIQN